MDCQIQEVEQGICDLRKKKMNKAKTMWVHDADIQNAEGQVLGGRVSPNLFTDKCHAETIKNKIYMSKTIKNMKDSLEETYNIKWTKMKISPGLSVSLWTKGLLV